MWWHKPLAPKEPFIMRGEWVKPLCAYMYMSSQISGDVSGESIESHTMVKSLVASLHLYSKVPELEGLAFHPEVAAIRASNNLSQDLSPSGRTTAESVSQQGSNLVPCTAVRTQGLRV